MGDFMQIQMETQRQRAERLLGTAAATAKPWLAKGIAASMRARARLATEIEDAKPRIAAARARMEPHLAAARARVEQVRGTTAYGHASRHVGTARRHLQAAWAKAEGFEVEAASGIALVVIGLIFLIYGLFSG